MEQREKVTIFHLYRKDGTALFLHPFDSLEKLLAVLRRSDIVGKYGAEPRVESLTLFRNDLYRMLEEAVRNWIAEARFIPRFILSAGAFLVTYIFMAFVIRDPIPLIDEILVGAGVSVACYFLLSRKDQRSNMALKKRADLRAAVDRILFQEDSFVREIEVALQKRDSETREKVLEEMLSGIESGFSIADESDARQLVSYLERRFNSREYKKQERLLARAHDSDSKDRDVAALNRWVETKKIDLSLFSVYRRVKKSSQVK